jgi:hypothetical protein
MKVFPHPARVSTLCLLQNLTDISGSINNNAVPGLLADEQVGVGDYSTSDIQPHNTDITILSNNWHFINLPSFRYALLGYGKCGYCRATPKHAVIAAYYQAGEIN